MPPVMPCGSVTSYFCATQHRLQIPSCAACQDSLTGLMYPVTSRGVTYRALHLRLRGIATTHMASSVERELSQGLPLTRLKNRSLGSSSAQRARRLPGRQSRVSECQSWRHANRTPPLQPVRSRPNVSWGAHYLIEACRSHI